VTVQLSGAVEQDYTDLRPKDCLFFNPDKVAAQAVTLLEDFYDSQDTCMFDALYNFGLLKICPHHHEVIFERKSHIGCSGWEKNNINFSSFFG
jgi:hypothetical protein